MHEASFSLLSREVKKPTEYHTETSFTTSNFISKYSYDMKGLDQKRKYLERRVQKGCGHTWPGAHLLPDQARVIML